MKVQADVERVLKEFIQASKPIGSAIGIHCFLPDTLDCTLTHQQAVLYLPCAYCKGKQQQWHQTHVQHCLTHTRCCQG